MYRESSPPGWYYLSLVAVGLLALIGAVVTGLLPIAKPDVAIYGIASCPFCQEAREWAVEVVKQHPELRVQYYDIEHDALARRHFTALGGRAVPLIVVRGQVIRGFDRPRIEYLLFGGGK